MSETVGFIAASLTTLSFLPQTFLVLRTGNTEGISLVMYMMFTLGVASWFSYGVMTHTLPIMLSNGVTVCLAATILSLKVRAVLQQKAQARAQGATLATSAPI